MRTALLSSFARLMSFVAGRVKAKCFGDDRCRPREMVKGRSGICLVFVLLSSKQRSVAVSFGHDLYARMRKPVDAQ